MSEPMNTSGFTPLDTRVIILPDEVSDKFAGSSLLRPDQVREKEGYAQTIGTLVAAGENAFIEWGAVTKPQPGDKVVYGKYAGMTHGGKDGKKYTVANDQDLLALWSA